METDNYLTPNFSRGYQGEDNSDDDLEDLSESVAQAPVPRRTMPPQLQTHINQRPAPPTQPRRQATNGQQLPQYVAPHPIQHVMAVRPDNIATAAAVGAGAGAAILAADTGSSGYFGKAWAFAQTHKIMIAIIIVIMIVLLIGYWYFGKSTNNEDQEGAPSDGIGESQPVATQSEPFGPSQSSPRPPVAPAQESRLKPAPIPPIQPKARPVREPVAEDTEDTASATPKKVHIVTASPATSTQAKPSLSAHDELLRSVDDEQLQKFLGLEEKDLKTANMTAKRAQTASNVPTSKAGAAATARAMTKSHDQMAEIMSSLNDLDIVDDS